MDLAQVQLLLDNQRKCFNDSISRLERQFTGYIQSNEKKINDLLSSLEFTQNELSDMKNKMQSQNTNTNTTQPAQLQHDNHELHQQLKEAFRRLDYLDDQGRRINLRFCGIPEQASETWEQCQHKLSRVLREQLNLTPEFERVHRVGRSSDRQPRDIVARFSRFTDRDAVFQNRRDMKGTNIFINEDLCPGTVDARRQQMAAYHDARRSGKFVYFNYRTLVVRDRRPTTATSTRPPLALQPAPHATTSNLGDGDHRTTTHTTADTPTRANSPRRSPMMSTTDFPALNQAPATTGAVTRTGSVAGGVVQGDEISATAAPLPNATILTTTFTTDVAINKSSLRSHHPI